MIYVVTNKLTGAEVYRYDSVKPVEWVGMEFSKFEHRGCLTRLRL